MYKKRVVGMLVLMVLLLSGCEIPEKLSTDSGSSLKKQVPKEEYLKTNPEQGQTVEDLYKVHILERGTFKEELKDKHLSLVKKYTPVNYDLSETAQFGEYLMEGLRMDVEEGDVVARVYTEVSEATVVAAQTELTRLEEQYEEAGLQAQEDLQDILDEKKRTDNDYGKKILDVRYKQRQLDWELEKYNYENRILEGKEKVRELNEKKGTYDIKAPISGVASLRIGEKSVKQKAGTELKRGDLLFTIVPAGVRCQSTSEFLPYGMEKEVILGTGTYTAQGRVLSVGSQALYGNLDSKDTVILTTLPDDQTTYLLVTESRLVDGRVKTIKDVVLVPKAAVSEEENKYYVMVLSEDGSTRKTGFIPGGLSSGVYWVQEGLTEGMKVVY